MIYYMDLNHKIHCLDSEIYENLLPAGCVKIMEAEAATIQADMAGMVNPQWNGTEFIETALVYHGVQVASKADVDCITGQRIINMGEEKAKTLLLKAIKTGSTICPEWDAFETARDNIVEEGNTFITANNLA